MSTKGMKPGHLFTSVILGAPKDLPERVQGHNPYQVSRADAARRVL